MRLALVCALLASGGASAQALNIDNSHWSVATGETVSPDRDALRFDLGWPGVGFTYLHGLSDRRDVGIQFELLWGLEETNNTKLGFGVGVPYRLVVQRHEKVTIEVHVVPGVRVYSGNGDTDLFLRAPVGGVLGIQVTPELRLGAGADLDIALQVPHTAFLEVGPRFGFDVEYAVDKTLQIAFDGRFGPQFYTVSGSQTDFAFVTQIVVGYRM